MDSTAQMARLVDQMIDAAELGRSFYAFTGAGISTDSGLPDFRSPGGIWEDGKHETQCSAAGFRRDPEPVWSIFVDGFFDADPKPNIAHRALVQLQRLGLIGTILTQNVDDLHQRAGSRPESVVHLHGHLETAYCCGCEHTWPLRELHAQRKATGQVPQCEDCAVSLQPSITLFNQGLEHEPWDRAQQVIDLARGALVVGSSLMVAPASELPRMTHFDGNPVAIIGRGETAMDGELREIDTRLEGEISLWLPALVRLARQRLRERLPA